MVSTTVLLLQVLLPAGQAGQGRCRARRASLEIIRCGGCAVRAGSAMLGATALRGSLRCGSSTEPFRRTDLRWSSIPSSTRSTPGSGSTSCGARAGETVDLAGVPGARVGRDRRARLRRGLADGRLGAQPGRDRDRARRTTALRRELPARAARLHDRRRRRLAVLHPRLHGRRAPRRAGGPRRGARRRSPSAALGLILDFVPNHVAPDHPWTARAPRVLRPRRARRTSSATRPRSSRVGDRVLANGRDPYFPAWPDVVQLNAFSPDLRGAVDRHARLDRRPVRRRPLRHGDADDERHLRAHLGRARRRRGPPTTTGRR